MKEINKIQKLNLELIRLSSFNEFDGERVVKDLENNRELWKGVVMDRADYCFHDRAESDMRINLIKLRDIDSNIWNVDTLFIIAEDGREDELELLASTWGAEEVDWIYKKDGERMLGHYNPHDKKDKLILRVWWD